MRKYLDDSFYWEGDAVARVFVDEDGDYGIDYRMERIVLYLGAVKLFVKWQVEMVEKYKSLTFNITSLNKLPEEEK